MQSAAQIVFDRDDVIDHHILTGFVAAFHFVVDQIDSVLDVRVGFVDVGFSARFSVLLIGGSHSSFEVWVCAPLLFDAFFVSLVPDACIFAFLVAPGFFVLSALLSQMIAGIGGE